MTCTLLNGVDDESNSKNVFSDRSDKLKPMFKDKDFEELDDHMENVEKETVDSAATGVSTISAPTLIKMKELKAKEKGVSITDVEDSSRIVDQLLHFNLFQPLILKTKFKDLWEEFAELERAQQERQRQEDDTNAALAKELNGITSINNKGTRLMRKIQVMYEKEKRWIDDFQPMDTETIKDSEKKADSNSKPAGGSRKKTLARKRAGEKKSEESAKKQKLEDVVEEQESAKSDEEASADYEHEKEELRLWLTVVSDEEETVDPKILSTKYPIVDWESQNLGNIDMEDLHVYKIIRVDRNTSYHKSLSSMLRIFDRRDLVDLHKLVMKRFKDTTSEGYNLVLWGDLKVMFEPNAEDEIWSNQQDWTLISWKLYESCGVHTLLMDGTLTSFSLLVENSGLSKLPVLKKVNYPLEYEDGSSISLTLFIVYASNLEGDGSIQTVSNEDANHKFLRALPSSWNNVALIMRKQNLDNALIVQVGMGMTGVYSSRRTLEFEEAIFPGNVKHQEINGAGIKIQGIGVGTTPEGLTQSVFDSRSSDGDDNQTNDRFKKDNEYHAVPPPITRNYIPPLADLSFVGLDDSVYRPTANKTSASVSQVETSNTTPSNTSVEMPRVEPVRPSGVIIEDWVSDDDEDIFKSEDSQTTVKPVFKKIKFTKARNEPVKSDKQAVKPRMVTQSPKVDRKDWNGKMTQKLGLGFGSTKKACFVYGSYSHLIKDCDFHKKRMAKKSVLKNMGKGSGQREIRPVWNNTQRINHQNKFVLTAVLT
ncbi:hypothetical protein Tco_1027030, partial [Tanacetum coccineum]